MIFDQGYGELESLYDFLQLTSDCLAVTAQLQKLA